MSECGEADTSTSTMTACSTVATGHELMKLCSCPEFFCKRAIVKDLSCLTGHIYNQVFQQSKGEGGQSPRARVFGVSRR